MAQTLRHIELALAYLQNSDSLQSGGFNNEAAEMVWGAIVNTIESIGHIATGNHMRNLSNKARRDLARNLPPTIFSQYHHAQTKLHAHFYHDILGEGDLQIHITRGRTYARQLIQIALQKQSGGELNRREHG